MVEIMRCNARCMSSLQLPLVSTGWHKRPACIHVLGLAAMLQQSSSSSTRTLQKTKASKRLAVHRGCCAVMLTVKPRLHGLVSPASLTLACIRQQGTPPTSASPSAACDSALQELQDTPWTRMSGISSVATTVSRIVGTTAHTHLSQATNLPGPECPKWCPARPDTLLLPRQWLQREFRA
jgi:hypothetical protein